MTAPRILLARFVGGLEWSNDHGGPVHRVRVQEPTGGSRVAECADHSRVNHQYRGMDGSIFSAHASMPPAST